MDSAGLIVLAAMPAAAVLLIVAFAMPLFLGRDPRSPSERGWLALPGRITESLQKQNPNERIRVQNDTRNSLLQGFTSFVLLSGLVISAQTAVAQRANNDQTISLARDQASDRKLDSAIAQIGDPKPEVRAVGLARLDQLARESDGAAQVAVTFAALYVRQHSTDSPNPPCSRQPRPADLQAAVDVLTNRPYQRLNLIGVDLHDIHLDGARLDTATLNGANFQCAVMRRAVLRGSVLIGARFSASDLGYADLSNAVMSGSDFETTNLMRANLSGGDLNDAHLGYASLRGAILRGSALIGAQFSRSDLADADLTNAVISGSHFVAANLTRANLRGVHLDGTDLTDALLTRTDLRSANLATARGLTRAQLSAAIIDQKTVLPLALRS